MQTASSARFSLAFWSFYIFSKKLQDSFCAAQKQVKWSNFWIWILFSKWETAESASNNSQKIRKGWVKTSRKAKHGVNASKVHERLQCPGSNTAAPTARNEGEKWAVDNFRPITWRMAWLHMAVLLFLKNSGNQPVLVCWSTQYMCPHDYCLW